MTTCRDVVEFCLEFLEGAMPSEEQTRFQSHLSKCGACVAFFETYRRTPEVSRSALSEEMPVQVKEAVRSYLRGRCRQG